MKTISSILLFLFTSTISDGQTWPIGSPDDLSSAFGPRNLGSINFEDPPEPAGYDYDFHRGVDIGRTGNVRAVQSGTVVEDGATHIIIESNVSSDYLRYVHIIPFFSVGQHVDEGDVVGSSDPAEDHFDIKWYPNNYLDRLNAKHPLHVLPYTNNNLWYETLTDRGVSNDSYGDYIEFFARVDDDELDIVGVEIFLEGRTTGGFILHEDDILAGNPPKNFVDYDFRVNIGDWDFDDSDDGFNNEIRIAPRVFYKDDPFHTVYFRFYLIPLMSFEWLRGRTIALSASNEFYIEDWFDIITGLCPPNCPPPGAPNSPENPSAIAVAGSLKVNLDWDPPSSGPFPDSYVIYRRPFVSDPSDYRTIGATTLEHYEDESGLPGRQYYYAIAALNDIGEGLNSSDVSATYPGAGTSYSDRFWNGEANITGEIIFEQGTHLVIHKGSILKFGAGARLTIKGQLSAEGTASELITFRSINDGAPANSWKSVYFDFTAGPEPPSTIKYAVIQDANNGVFGRYADNLTIENSTIQNNVIGIYPWHAETSGTDTMKILSNTIKDNKRHGIYNYFSDPIIYNNTITSNDEEAGYGWGIYLRSASPRIGKNTITYNLKDGVLSTSPGGTAKLYYDPVGNPRGGYNTITNNTRDGVYAGSFSSNPLLILGTTSDPGENSIKNNTGFEVSNHTSYTVLAECNEWGTSPTFFGNVDRDPETGDIGCPGQQVGMGFEWLYAALNIYPDYLIAQSDVLTNTIREATAEFTSGNYAEALQLLRAVVRDFPNSDGIPYALTLASESYRELDRKPDSRTYLTGLSNQRANTLVKRFAKLLLMHDLEGNREFTEALSLGDDILSDTPTDEEINDVLFRQGMILAGGLDDVDGAMDKFSEIISLFPGTDAAFFAAEQLEYLNDGVFGKGAIVEGSGNKTIPEKYSLSNNYPNPFNPETRIDFALPEAGLTRLVIYDLLGREVARLIDGELSAGYHEVKWDASESASGIYFYRLTSGDFVKTKKMLLLK